jgi:isoleucyl-tRNA synthetase
MHMFDPVDPKQALPDVENGILQYWKEEDTFKRSIKQRWKGSGDLLDGKPGTGDDFSFYDGPPFATGLPHYGHLLAGTIKDVIPRYQTMRGKCVQRRFGWDCHGLPVENLVEKEHGIKDKAQIEAMGVAAFNTLCRNSVQRYTNEWKQVVERMGRWVDMDWDYRTMDPEYMESIWWVVGELHKKQLLYRGHRPMHVCPRCVTPLSNFEVTQGYKDVTDQSVIAKFKLLDELPLIKPKKSGLSKYPVFILAWTTTPWTLPGNLMLAVGQSIRYAVVLHEEALYVVAKNKLAEVFKDKEHEVVMEYRGGTEGLVGLKYEPLFPYFAEKYKDAFRIVAGDFVSTEDGTGIVHIAPGFGEDDFQIGKQEELELLQHVTMDGKFVDTVTDFAGQDVKPIDDPRKTDQKIIAWLEERGLVFSKETYKHSYPHCWRCDSPLLNYATSSWFVSVEKLKENLLKNNAKTEWVPGHIRDGRFGKWLENARDWAISRNRYWGTPLPVWINEKTGDMEVVESRDELLRRAPQRFTKVTFVRHGESEGNLIPIYQGNAPGTDLTKTGKAQAAATGELLSTQEVRAVYASPLARAHQTALAIAEHSGGNVVTDERLREVQFGEYEGKTVDFDDLAFVKARRAHKLKENSPESIYHFPGMETWDEVQDRLSTFLQEVLPKHRGEHIVVVTHADVLQNAKHFFSKENPGKISHQPYPRYAEPHVFYWDHERGAQMDLHKDTVDDITWKDAEGSVYRRIPEVLDCWFESGSMPYAQSHYPFSHAAQELPPGFPADFIAEGVDQTRGWFYTLAVLATALFDKPAFRHCVVNGIVLAEDGKKMSKRLKNYPEPTEIVEKYGADAIRFTLMRSPAVRGEDLRMSEKLVEESLRQVLLPLWNTYSFFVTYANAAQFEAIENRRHSVHPLDQWIRTEVQDLVNRMTEQLDRYDLSATCAELGDTIDALTNWYIRLSRRRFAGKAERGSASEVTRIDTKDDDQLDALHTLHDVLLTISQVLAPFCPFITEAIYLNLVSEEHGSIHLTDWPQTQPLTKEQQTMLQKTTMLRTIVSLGLSVRSDQKIKVRQPLASATIAVPPAFVNITLGEEDKKLLTEELNVKELVFVDDPGALATAVALVDARKVGPRLGGRVQEIIRAGKEGNFTVKENGMILILDEELSAEEAQIVYRGAEGQNVAADKGIVVSMDTTVSPALEQEGLARDVIRAVQRLRKDAGLSFTDEISLVVMGADEMMQQHGTMIARETRSVLQPNDGEEHTIDVEGHKMSIRFMKR